MIDQPLPGLNRNQTGKLLVFFSDITCGESCWSAKEEICRCSCGGRNHGISLRDGNAERTAKIDGYRYRLHSVGKHRDLRPIMIEMQRALDVESGHAYERDGKLFEKVKVFGVIRERSYSPDIDLGKKRGDAFRLKYASLSQCVKWKELLYMDVMTENDRYKADAAILWELIK